MPSSNNNLVEIKNLCTYFYVKGFTAKAVDSVSLSIPAGQTLGLVGESGCGKSVTAHSIIRLIPEPPGKIENGQIFFDGQDLVKFSEAQMRKIRGEDRRLNNNHWLSGSIEQGAVNNNVR